MEPREDQEQNGSVKFVPEKKDRIAYDQGLRDAAQYIARYYPEADQMILKYFGIEDNGEMGLIGKTADGIEIEYKNTVT